MRATEETAFPLDIAGGDEKRRADPVCQAPVARLWPRYGDLLLSGGCGASLLLGWLGGLAGGPRAVQLLLYGLAYLAGGWSGTQGIVRALRNRTLDINVLMITAALGAAAIGEWVEGGVLLFLFSLSSSLEGYAMGRTRSAITNLIALRPQEALVRRDGREVRAPVESLRPGDRILVKPGERVAADGLVRAGSSAMDESPLTGESMPVARGPGDPVLAGTINGPGALEVEVTRRAEETTLAKIIRLVAQAQSEKATTQRLIDRFGRVYVPAVLGLVACLGLVPILLGRDPGATVYRAITLLVVASPCALVISTPASVLSAIANAARHGILFKGGLHLETMARVRVLAFDKTGTLTGGRPRVTDVVAADGASEAEVLRLAAALEGRSEHPIARAIVAEARGRGVGVPEAAEVRALLGRGVRGRVGGGEAYVGTARLVAEMAQALHPALARRGAALEAAGKTVMVVGDPVVRGLIAVADTLRPGAPETLRALRAGGIQRTAMLTGDNAAVAGAIAAAAGIDEVHAGLLPEEKVRVIRRLGASGGGVGMVGDGVNDAPALAAASVGIAMGGAGSDAALETADVVLMADDLGKLPYALGLCRRARRVIIQNLACSCAVIAGLIALTFAGWTTLSLGVVGHEGNTLLVVLNGLRLLRDS
jgi:Cd2+/Zn2+-exporting ATPase